MTPEELEQIRVTVQAGIDGGMEAVSANLAGLREQINHRLDDLAGALASLQRRLDRVEHLLTGFDKAIAEAGHLDSRNSTAQAAHQRLMDDLARSLRELTSRVADLERRR